MSRTPTSSGGSEFSSEASLDYIYSTPDNHATFAVSTGDSAAPGGWPAFSPDVLAVGGTSLYSKLDSTGATVYDHETGWSSGGGGISVYEPKPSYQGGLSYSARATPDVSMDADPSTGVYVVLAGVGFQVGGTSLSAPLWSALLADLNQGRALRGDGTLGNAQGLVYKLSTGDFHDVTAGSNGFSAGPGYDLVTGIGTPYANTVVKDLLPAKSFSLDGTTGHGRLKNQQINMTPLAISLAQELPLLATATPSAQQPASVRTVAGMLPVAVAPSMTKASGYQLSTGMNGMGAHANDANVQIAALDPRTGIDLATQSEVQVRPDYQAGLGGPATANLEDDVAVDGLVSLDENATAAPPEALFEAPTDLMTMAGVAVIAAITLKSQREKRAQGKWPALRPCRKPEEAPS